MTFIFNGVFRAWLLLFKLGSATEIFKFSLFGQLEYLVKSMG